MKGCFIIVREEIEMDKEKDIIDFTPVILEVDTSKAGGSTLEDNGSSDTDIS